MECRTGRQGRALPRSLFQLLPAYWPRQALRVRANSKLASLIEPAMENRRARAAVDAPMFANGDGVEQIAPGLRSCASIGGGKTARF